MAHLKLRLRKFYAASAAVLILMMR
jgi:hypothetical protein